MINQNHCLRNVIFAILIALATGCHLKSQDNTTLDIATVTFDDQTYPIVILGGGMAGLTAAEYSLNANIPCLVIEGPMPGGSLSQAHSIRNWPGVIDAPGADIVGSIRKQAQANGLKMLKEKVVNVDLSQWPRIIKTQTLDDPSKTNTIKALAVIIAMGTDQKFLGIPGESGSEGYWGKGVGKCCVCEGPLCKGKHVAIVGGGDGALHEADYLAGIATKVTMFVRGESLDEDIKNTKAKERVLRNPIIEVMYNTEVKKMLGNGSKLTGVLLLNNKTNEQTEFNIDKLFLAIGSQPNTALFKDQLELSEKGFILLKNRRESSVPGVYAGGDVSDDDFVQAVTAASDGCKSTLQAIAFLRALGFDISMLPETMLLSKQEIAKPEETNKNVSEIKTEKDFDILIAASQQLVVLDIFSPMCTSCQQMMPIIHTLADTFAGKITFAKLNASNKDLDLEQLLKKIGGNAPETLPAFIFIKDGKEISRFDGTFTLEEFKKRIDTVSQKN